MVKSEQLQDVDKKTLAREKKQRWIDAAWSVVGIAIMVFYWDEIMWFVRSAWEVLTKWVW